jgi:hypothetical protein
MFEVCSSRWAIDEDELLYVCAHGVSRDHRYGGGGGGFDTERR